MPRSSASVDIARPVDEVFAFVADLRNEPQWHVDVAEVPPDTDPVPVVGKSYPVKFRPFMGKTDGTFTPVEVVAGSRIVYDGEMVGIRPHITYTFEPVGSGTRFTRAIEVKLGGMMRLMTPMMALMLPRGNRTFVENLKRILEV